MTQEKKPTDAGKTIIEPTRIGDGEVLSDNELNAVTGGSSLLGSAFSNAIKAIGEGLAAAARKG